MRRRKLVIALAAAAVFGVLVVPASAELHRVSVTLVTGQTLTLTVDVPPGASVESIEIPGLPAPVQSISDLGPVATATPTPSATTTPAPTQTPGSDNTPTPTPSPTEPPGDGNEPVLARAREQGRRQQGRHARSPRSRDPSTLDPNTEALNGELDETAKETAPEVDETNPTRNVDGSPTLDNPTVSLSTPGPARIGVPNFFIEKFRIPPFLLPIYQAAGIEYGVRWEVLAAINEIETDYGRNLNVSSAGALGWMQFMPASWDAYGVDGNRDGVKDPYNPVDAIFAAARYLKAAGADTDLRGAIFAYNHADWYVDSVILRARYIGGLPADLVGSLSGLTQGRFPVQAKASYAKDVRRTRGQGRRRPTSSSPARAATASRSSPSSGSPVVAVNDGRIVKTGHSRRLGNFVTLQDVYGNTYTYGHLKSVVEVLPDAQAQGGGRQAGPARARAPAARRRARPARRRRRRRPSPSRARPPGRRASRRRRRSAAPRGTPPRRRSACSPTRSARTARPPAATSRPTRSRRTSAATSTASSASTAPRST